MNQRETANAEISFYSDSITELVVSLGLSRGARSNCIHFLDLHSLTYFGPREFKKIFLEDLNVSDGKPFYIFRKLLGKPVTYCRGTDFMRDAITNSTDKQQHFFFGSSQTTLDLLVAEVLAMNPNLSIAGALSPSFTNDGTKLVNEALEALKKIEANVIWVGLGSPKQLLVASELSKHVSGDVISVGAAFDFLSKTKKECPQIYSLLGLEWLYRVKTEPKRLTNRYLQVAKSSPRLIWSQARATRASKHVNS